MLALPLHIVFFAFRLPCSFLLLTGHDALVNSPGKNIGVGSHSLLKGIFPTQYQIWVSCIAGIFFTV